MTNDERKTEPPLYLNMDFEEALSRFARVRPEEVKESVERSKQKKTPGAKDARRRPKKSKD